MKHFKVLLATIALCWLVISPLTAAETKSRSGGMKFNDVEEQTREFIGYFNSIKLTQEQKKASVTAGSKVVIWRTGLKQSKS